MCVCSYTVKDTPSQMFFNDFDCQLYQVLLISFLFLASYYKNVILRKCQKRSSKRQNTGALRQGMVFHEILLQRNKRKSYW